MSCVAYFKMPWITAAGAGASDVLFPVKHFLPFREYTPSQISAPAQLSHGSKLKCFQIPGSASELCPQHCTLSPAWVLHPGSLALPGWAPRWTLSLCGWPHRASPSLSLPPQPSPAPLSSCLSLSGSWGALTWGAGHSLPLRFQGHSGMLPPGLAFPGWQQELIFRQTGMLGTGLSPVAGRECAVQIPGQHGRGCQCHSGS